MTIIYDVSTNEFIEKLAEELKKNDKIVAPDWARFVKTGMHKERPPVNPDWWYVRAAAVLRSVAILGPVGVSKLRRKYGGKKNMGVAPERFFKGSGSIIRKILIQLEAAGLVKQAEKGVHKGRVIAGPGDSLIYKVASALGGKVSKSSKVSAKETSANDAPSKSAPAKESESKKEAKEETAKVEVTNKEAKKDDSSVKETQKED